MHSRVKIMNLLFKSKEIFTFRHTIARTKLNLIPFKWAYRLNLERTVRPSLKSSNRVQFHAKRALNNLLNSHFLATASETYWKLNETNNPIFRV